ncbi:tetratricopeptide repeat protein [Streptomyces sp. AJS327]|uniref:tetratricopeptide repeat protein n=1 Tax=Streptomyces sp. AJS327 TaxID=2545265 RepID=UPI0015DF8421|nr:tetratricopeptide repeat protein [Streptomyces sp. AJS327]
MVSARASEHDDVWRELELRLAPWLERDAGLRRLRDSVESAGNPLNELTAFAERLAVLAREDQALSVELRTWLAGRPSATGNTIDGSARVYGPTVQAGAVRDVHFHQSVSAQPPPESSPFRVPRELPAARPYFVGRDAELRELDAYRSAVPDSGVQLLVVSGLAGVGKTALLTHWLRGCADEFPDGQLYAELNGYDSAGPKEPGAVLEHLLRSIGVRSVPTETYERVALWRSLTANRRLAVMVDDALTAGQVRPLLPSGAGSLTVVTSRNHLTGLLVDGATLYRLDTLSTEASVELLAGSGVAPRVRREPDAAREVARLCARLPLALCLAASQLAVRPGQTLSSLADSLAGAQGPLEALRADGEAAVRVALDASYRLLPPDAAVLYRALGLLPAPSYDPAMAAAVTGQSAAERDRSLEVLLDNNLLEELAPERYRFHDLVLPHARECAESADTAEQRGRTLRRYVDWCLATATAAEELLTPSHRNLARTYVEPPAETPRFSDETMALRWLETHGGALEGAVRQCAEAGWHATCWQLVDASWPWFLRLRPTEWWVKAHQLGIVSARALSDREAVSRMLTSGGAGLRNAARHGEAATWYAEALEHARSHQGPREVAQALNGLGNACLAAGELTDAEGYFVEALTLRESIGYSRGAALSRVCLGQTALAAGRHPHAVPLLTRARDELLAAGDAYDAARALAFLGEATAGAGDYPSGERLLRQAVDEFRATGSAHWRARTLEKHGQAAQEHGDVAVARDSYRTARDIYRPLSPTDAARLEELLAAL